MMIGNDCMRRKRLFLLVLSLGLVLPGEAASDGVVPFVTGMLGKVGTFIDSMSVSGLDRRYIEATEKPWQGGPPKTMSVP